MIKATVVLALALLSQVAQADLSCYEPEVMDAALVATFHNLDNDRAVKTVSLSIPKGEMDADVIKGVCRNDKGAIERAMTCNVLTSTDSGYIVRLYSIGGAALKASVQQWNMMGNVGAPEVLPCIQNVGL